MDKILRSGEVKFRSFCDDGGTCVEAAPVSLVAVRDSKSPEGPALLFTRNEWKNFLDGAKAGYFDFFDFDFFDFD